MKIINFLSCIFQFFNGAQISQYRGSKSLRQYTLLVTGVTVSPIQHLLQVLIQSHFLQ